MRKPVLGLVPKAGMLIGDDAGLDDEVDAF